MDEETIDFLNYEFTGPVPELYPRLDDLTAHCRNLCLSVGKYDPAVKHRYDGQKVRLDDQVAPLMAEKLRHTYQTIHEKKFPERQAFEGKILPIDNEVNPGALEYEYFVIESEGCADWIDDNGTLLNTSSTILKRFTGKVKPIGDEWVLNYFELQRHAMAGTKIPAMKPQLSKKHHATKTNWVWLFGDAEYQMEGLCNHPNITVLLAPEGVSGRKWEDKTAEEILADIDAVINAAANNTLMAHRTKRVLMSQRLQQILINKVVKDTYGVNNLWKFVTEKYSPTGAGVEQVVFEVLVEAQAEWRRDPITNTDTSGIVGDFLLAMPEVDKELAAFVRAQPYTTHQPEKRGFDLVHQAHSTIGGARIAEPLAFTRMDGLA